MFRELMKVLFFVIIMLQEKDFRGLLEYEFVYKVVKGDFNYLVMFCLELLFGFQLL